MVWITCPICGHEGSHDELEVDELCEVICPVCEEWFSFGGFMKRIEWTWRNGSKSYSIPFRDEFAKLQLDSMRDMISQDPSYDGVVVNLIDADTVVERFYDGPEASGFYWG